MGCDSGEKHTVLCGSPLSVRSLFTKLTSIMHACDPAGGTLRARHAALSRSRGTVRVTGHSLHAVDAECTAPKASAPRPVWLGTGTQPGSHGWGRCPFSDHCPPNPVLSDPRALGGGGVPRTRGFHCRRWGLPTSPHPALVAVRPDGWAPCRPHPALLTAWASASPSVPCEWHQSHHTALFSRMI